MTPRQAQAVSLALRYGNREAARRMFISREGVRGLLREVYAEYGILDTAPHGARNWLVVEAAIAAGWLTLPPETI